MKRILVVLAVLAGIGMSACKKENDVKPSSVKEQVMTGEKKDMGGWD